MLTTSYNYLISAGENPVIDAIPQEHQDYARLVNNVYLNNRENVGNYQYVRSLNMPNTMVRALGAAAGGVASQIIYPQLYSASTRERMGLHTNLARRDMRTFDSFLPYLAKTIETSEVVGQQVDFLLPEETGLDEVITIESDIIELFYEYKLPFGLIGIPTFAIAYQHALDNIKASEISIDNTAPRMSYYRQGNKDIFAIRGTDGVEDVINDAEMLIKKISPLIAKKLKVYEEFINKNARPGSEIILAGHSLGSLEANILKENMKKREINVIGYGHPYFQPHKDAIVYSFKEDPLYFKSGVDNHKVLEKQYIKGKGIFQQHSILNYF